MSNTAKGTLAVAGGVVATAVVVFVLLGGREASSLGGIFAPEPATCPLTDLQPKREAAVERPAIAVKVENNPVAYPLSGLERAEIVYEELVEGGMTRFMAIYHCTDAAKVGPIRSTREIDPAIMTPTTRILVGAGGNAIVREALNEADIILIDEPGAGEAMERVPRVGIASEHTLYGNTARLRKLGARKFDEPPPGQFEFGEPVAKGKRARSITINFSPTVTVSYQWSDGRWLRFDGDEPLVMESGDQIAVDNVIVEQHTINLSQKLSDILGTPSIEIADVTGSGRAVLFRGGRAVEGRWERETVEGAVRFVTRSGEEMTLAAGTTWIELVPNDKGDVEGSFSYAR